MAEPSNDSSIQTHATKHQAPSTKHQAPSTKHQAPYPTRLGSYGTATLRNDGSTQTKAQPDSAVMALRYCSAAQPDSASKAQPHSNTAAHSHSPHKTGYTRVSAYMHTCGH